MKNWLRKQKIKLHDKILHLSVDVKVYNKRKWTISSMYTGETHNKFKAYTKLFDFHKKSKLKNAGRRYKLKLWCLTSLFNMVCFLIGKTHTKREIHELQMQAMLDIIGDMRKREKENERTSATMLTTLNKIEKDLLNNYPVVNLDKKVLMGNRAFPSLKVSRGCLFDK